MLFCLASSLATAIRQVVSQDGSLALNTVFDVEWSKTIP